VGHCRMGVNNYYDTLHAIALPSISSYPLRTTVSGRPTTPWNNPL
jgi:hypothetical protein